MENDQLNQTSVNIPFPETPKALSIDSSVFLILLELGLIFFYAYSAADEIASGSWALLGAAVPALFISTPLGIFSFYLAFVKYKKRKKILALVILIVGISSIFPFSIEIGRSLAPLFVPIIEQKNQEYYQNTFEPTALKLISDRKAKEDQARDSYLEKRYGELQKSFKPQASITKIVFSPSYVQLSDGRKISLIYRGSPYANENEVWKKIDLKNVQVKLPNFEDFSTEYQNDNMLNWSDSFGQKIGLYCPSDSFITNSNRDDICSEKIPALIYANNILVNQLFGSDTNRVALEKYNVQ